MVDFFFSVTILNFIFKLTNDIIILLNNLSHQKKYNEKVT